MGLWSIKYSGEVLSKLKSREFRATRLSTYCLSALYTRTKLPHSKIKQKHFDLVARTFNRKERFILPVTTRRLFYFYRP